MMRRLIIILLGTMALGAVSANAADMPMKGPIYKAPPPAPAYSWTGFYAGLNAGAAWADPEFTWTANPAGFGGAAGAADVNNVGNRNIDGVGFVGGGQIGYNYQFNNFLISAEADIQYTGARSSYNSTVTFASAGTTGNVHESFSSDWLATVRARLGYADGPWLFYGTGGLAVGRISFSDYVYYDASGTFNAASGASTNVGWTAGGGFEWAFAPGWSLKAEYLYVDLGNVSYSSANSNPALFPLATIAHDHSFTENIARIGVNYRFFP